MSRTVSLPYGETLSNQNYKGNVNFTPIFVKGGAIYQTSPTPPPNALFGNPSVLLQMTMPTAEHAHIVMRLKDNAGITLDEKKINYAGASHPISDFRIGVFLEILDSGNSVDMNGTVPEGVAGVAAERIYWGCAPDKFDGAGGIVEMETYGLLGNGAYARCLKVGNSLGEWPPVNQREHELLYVGQGVIKYGIRFLVFNS